MLLVKPVDERNPALCAESLYRWMGNTAGRTDQLVFLGMVFRARLDRHLSDLAAVD